MRELEEALECGDRMTSDAAKILSDCSEKLGSYSSKTAPVRDRARTLTTASRNIRQAREKCEQISTSLDMSRRLQVISFSLSVCSSYGMQSTIQRGPGDNMDAFLTAVDELEGAFKLEGDVGLSLVCLQRLIRFCGRIRCSIV